MACEFKYSLPLLLSGFNPLAEADKATSAGIDVRELSLFCPIRLILFAALFSSVIPTIAQTGSVTGLVTDTSGAVVADDGSGFRVAGIAAQRASRARGSDRKR